MMMLITRIMMPMPIPVSLIFLALFEALLASSYQLAANSESTYRMYIHTFSIHSYSVFKLMALFQKSVAICNNQDNIISSLMQTISWINYIGSHVHIAR